MIDRNQIPVSWEVVKLGEVCEKVSLNKIKIKEKEYLIAGKFPVVDQGQKLIGGYFDDENLVVPGEPPYVIFGDHTKVKKFISFRFIAGADGVKVLKPCSIYDAKFFYYLIHIVKIPDKGYARHFQFLEKEEIPLPPLPEQHRIVSKIEELFSELDKGIESLKTAQQQLKIYRQAVLKWAFEGRLTHENVKDGELPEGWKWVKLGEIAEVKRGKSKHRPRDDKKLFGGEYPFIQTGEIRAAKGGIVNRFTQTYSEIGLQQSKLWPKGTLCLTIAANIAETAFLGFDSCFPDSVVGISANGNILELKYVNYFIRKLKKEIESKASATAQKNINVEFLENLEIPFCELSEQKQIVQKIETRLSVCDKLGETITTALQQSEALRQSILKKAFEGNLVEQDPKDEPVVKLLERIKAEKAAEQRYVYRKGKPSTKQSSVGAK